MGPTVAAPSARAFATVEDLLRGYPPNPKLRAPKLPGDWLYVANKPGRGDHGVDVAAPRDLSHSPYEAEFRRWRADARKRLLVEAFAWSSAYRDRLPAPQEGAELLLSGHQPEFFHPGVWFKNFLLDAEARASVEVRAGERRIVPVNVIIDYDLCAKRNVLHPTVDGAGVRLDSIDLDRPAPPAPHERSPIVDREFLAAFPRRLGALREASWRESEAPIAEPLFREARETIASAESFGQFVATARHRFEETIGLSTLEVPFSRLAEEASFREFAWVLLRDAESFRRTYNASLRAVRVVQKLRSKTHPAPELTERDGWIEAAFWIWTKDDPRRRRLFVRNAAGGEFEISDLATIRESIGGGDEIACGGERVAELSRQGIAIRPRALTATIWMRAVLADGFLHGIGGAKYDQAADLLMGAWFGAEPPAYRIATATFNLTERTPADAARSLAERRRLLRDLQQHPERHAVDADAIEVRDAAKQIAQMLLAVPASGINARTHRELTAARERLRDATAEQVDSTVREIERLEREVRDRKILDSRERSFLLFDAETLPGRLRQAAEQAVASRKAAPQINSAASSSEWPDEDGGRGNRNGNSSLSSQATVVAALAPAIIEVLPAVAAATSSHRFPMEDFFSENTVTGKPLEILLVEDAVSHAKTTLAALDQLPFRHRVSLVRDGVEAAKFLRQEGVYRRAPRPEIVMLDWSLLSSSGSEALDVLRATPALADVQMILVADTDEMGKCESPVCARHLLTKPVQLENFLEVMRTIRDECQRQGRFAALDLVG